MTEKRDDLSLDSTPAVNPEAIRGDESPADLLRTAFPAFVGRQVRTAYDLMARSIDSDHFVYLTMSGAMTPAGLHQSCVVPLVQRGLVDVITTTGANLYHDAHRVIGHAVHEIAPDAGDTALREAQIIRIYDLGFTEDTLLDTDRLFTKLLRRPEMQRPMTTPELHYELGKQLAAIEQSVGARRPCLLSACYQAGVPIFVGAPQDGSIFLNAVKLRALFGDDFKFRLDPNRDVYTMAALQWLTQSTGNTAVWMLGGGVPKNYTLQGEPTLSQILGVDARGFDIDVQFCVDPVDNGALSSCPAGEGHTWGKVSAECVTTGSIYVHTDVTAVLPWLVHALFAPGRRREPKRLYDRLGEATAALDALVARNRDTLLADLDD